MRKTITAAALAAILAGAAVPALAAETLSPAAPPAAASESAIGSTSAIRANDLIGAEVTNAVGEKVGEVTDLVIGENNTVSAAIISVGGFLGVGDKQVAISLAELTVTPIDRGEVRVQIAATAEQLKALPEIQLN
ncbi:PRC-barrel domain-containing protein [Zavarzinia compransoris]|uniref:PRC-barrel domain-containing protein n=1 Tax=Zavarzinia compransoris TaxID=1264899 RepID=A0A317EA84_9PROT|nr:PRC-barrel domain-containing protein [Zavarzinia compransoris]PWR22085.1 hypothetical protein DKG75_08915 [Zavarzinia compransoris]TDP47171.1 PRC-barrel domain protein [Zavarzinia compransoris]